MRKKESGRERQRQALEGITNETKERWGRDKGRERNLKSEC